jgi:hypothetical protein
VRNSADGRPEGEITWQIRRASRRLGVVIGAIMDDAKFREMLRNPDDRVITEVLVHQLNTCGETLPPELRERILAQGSAAIVPLLRFLGDEEEIEYADAPVHAIDLLVELKATEAILPMLRILVEIDCTNALYELIVEKLPELGAAVIAPALALIKAEPDVESLFAICEVLSHIKVSDDRVFVLLRKAFNESPLIGASYFKDYGDKRAVPLIERALDQLDWTKDPRRTLSTVRTLVDAYQGLSGPLPDRLKARLDARMPRTPAR